MQKYTLDFAYFSKDYDLTNNIMLVSTEIKRYIGLENLLMYKLVWFRFNLVN